MSSTESEILTRRSDFSRPTNDSSDDSIFTLKQSPMLLQLLLLLLLQHCKSHPRLRPITSDATNELTDRNEIIPLSLWLRLNLPIARVVASLSWQRNPQIVRRKLNAFEDILFRRMTSPQILWFVVFRQRRRIRGSLLEERKNGWRVTWLAQLALWRLRRKRNRRPSSPEAEGDWFPPRHQILSFSLCGPLVIDCWTRDAFSLFSPFSNPR